MAKGYLALVLHAHLPFVRHPESDSQPQEDWLFEGISETYLPLLRILEKLASDGVPYRLTLSISPTLAAMLTDSLMQERYVRRITSLTELAEKEVARTEGQPRFHSLALMYLKRYKENLEEFTDRYNRDLVAAFAGLQKAGYLELITTSASHAFLPLLQDYPKGVEAQVRVATMCHREAFGKSPKGFWLPECGYYPGLEEFLDRNGLRFFFVDSHAITFADESPRYGVYSPVACESGLAAFGRDPKSSRAVWSIEDGYPGDISYRAFYRDIGFDLPLDYLRPYVHKGDMRINTGIKYYSITGPGEEKRPYDRLRAEVKADEHSDNFLYRLEKQFGELAQYMDRTPLVVTPFDAELFGHWWFEGTDWLEAVIRKAASHRQIDLVTPSDYLKKYPKNQVVTPSLSSWGNKGYSEVWLNESNDWLYRHIHKATERMTKLAQMFPSTDGIRTSALNQAARELLLLQASDWAFIMATGLAVNYARRRAKEHIHNFNKIYEILLNNHLDMEWLNALEEKNNLFPDMDYSIFL
jgi:1,4-alpha-glucan branching enzyme